MGKEVNLNNSVERLVSIFSYRWEKEIEFLHMLDAEETLSSEPRLLNGKDLLLPIHMETHFLGAVKVKNASEISFETVDEMHSLSRLILEYPLYSQYTERNLSECESLAKGPAERRSSSYEDSNLIEIFQAKASCDFSSLDAHFEDRPIESDDAMGAEEFMKSSTPTFADDLRPHPVSQVFHIGGSGEKDLMRIADWIHSRLGNWSLLRWQDLQASQAPIEELSALGRCTIIVNDLASLDSTQTRYLRELIGRSTGISGDGPTFLLLTEAPLEDLDLSQPRNQWLESLTSYSLDMRRVAVEPKKVMSTFELFFFN